ncbi:MAG TPA: hypothetical protein VKB12_01020 [Pyrinomonadaceae bacterium]|nr:hypothetical protein [Pyrinomonadaceae bacterium]
MEETKHTFADDEGEETMVAPRFDDEETVLARPVVPFEEVGDAPASATVPPPPPLYTRLRGAPRRSLVAALVLVSALAGSVLGVAGLYFYQKHKSADAPATRQQQAEAPAAQPATETASESQGGGTSVPAATEPSAPAAAEPDAEDDDADTARDKDSDADDASPVAERRNASEDRESTATPKRGKKGARDEEIQRGAQRAPRYDEDDRPVVRDDDRDDRREARRVGVITYRPRRARRDADGSPDRLRRIFEGQP